MKSITFFVSFCIFFLPLNLCFANGPVVSPIGQQSVMVGGKINIYFSTVGPDITFSSTDLPSFISLIDNGDKSGFFSVNTLLGDEGNYLFHLETVGNSGTTIQPISLEVKAIPTGATIYYSDPINGDINNVGDSLNPYPGLEELFNSFPSFEAGDIIFCRDGFHGFPKIVGSNSDFVTITAQANHQPTTNKLFFANSNRWIVSGLDISPENEGTTELGEYVKFNTGARNIILENCKIYSIDDADIWTVNQDWYDNVGNGILQLGEDCIIRNNYLKNTYFSVTIQGKNNRFEYNTIDRFGGDAIRGLADNISISHNVIKNAIVDDYDDVGGNHDDAFQSWLIVYPPKNMVISGNQIFNYTDPDIPLLSPIMQGIVNFDGFMEDWVVENNLVVQDHPHGIALFGAKNCKVINNTVIRNPLQLFFFGENPWIRINPHKDGRSSFGNLVRNNYTGVLFFDFAPGTLDHNIVNADYSDYLADYDNWDFHPKAGSDLIDAGLKEDAPTTDNKDFVRLSSDPIDLGCFEFDANIYDIEPPSSPTNITINMVENSNIDLSWSASTDNVEVLFYLISTAGKTIRTNQTTCNIFSLTSATNYDIEIRAVDFSGNTSEPLLVNQSTTPIDLTSTYEILVPILKRDQQIRPNNKFFWVGLHEHSIGGIFNTQDASAVYPFQLPEIMAGMEIKRVDFRTTYNGLQNTPLGNVDLYGLDFDSENCVRGTDHWQGEFGNATAIGTPIKDDFVETNTVEGLISLDTSAQISLADFVNSQITNGMNVDDYLFLRLNIDVEDENFEALYKFSSTDDIDNGNRPYLVFTLGEIETGLEQLENNNLEVVLFPNPISVGEDFSLQYLSQVSGNFEIKITDIAGQVIWKTEASTFLNTKDVITIPNNITHSGMYFLQLNNGEQVFLKKIIVK